MKKLIFIIIIFISFSVRAEESSENNKFADNNMQNNLYFSAYKYTGQDRAMISINHFLITILSISYVIPEFLVDYHNKVYYKAAMWEFPVGFVINKRAHFIIPSFIYYPKGRKRGFSFMYYCEVYPVEESRGIEFQLFCQLGVGMLKDSFGYGPKTSIRINTGCKDIKTLIGILFCDISYIRDYKMKWNRYQCSIGAELFL
jgi:hypothetical protein